MKKNLLGVVLVLLFVTNVCSASSGQDATGGRLADKVKFGLGFGRGFTEGSPMLSGPYHPSGEYRFLDIFGEYKFSDAYGLLFSIQPTTSSLRQTERLLDVGYFNVGLTNRVYVGQDKQLCFFFGGEIGILGSAKLKRKNFSGKDVELDLCKAEDLEEYEGPKSELDKSIRRMKFGWDYECENGLIIGGIFTSTWGSVDKKGNNPDIVEVLPTSTQQLFYLGYNFAKLFN